MPRTNCDTLMEVGNSLFHNVTSARMIFTYYDIETIENFTTMHILTDYYQCNPLIVIKKYLLLIFTKCYLIFIQR